MQVTLKITAGPHTGQKVLLRSGQLARIGRTEWADFSFPRDAQLADVHFAVRCDRAGLSLRQLAADRPVLVNQKPVREAELRPGDEIAAGQSVFRVHIEGQAASGAPLAAGAGAAGAAAATAMAPSPPPQGPTAAEIAELLELGADAVALAQTAATPQALVAALAEQEQFSKAVRVQAHLLDKRLCVWWGIVAVRGVGEDALSPQELAALQAAENWVADPCEDLRRAAEAKAAATKFDGPGSWLAMAAFWSGGSLTAPHLAVVPPDDKLTGQAVTNSLLIAAVQQQPGKATERYRLFLTQAQDVASGKLPPPQP
jgi:hypothetical protein